LRNKPLGERPGGFFLWVARCIDQRALALVLRVVIAAEVEPAVAGAPTSGQMVIVVGRDRRVIVDAGVDAAALARVLEVLERR
jgi:transposase